MNDLRAGARARAVVALLGGTLLILAGVVAAGRAPSGPDDRSAIPPAPRPSGRAEVLCRAALRIAAAQAAHGKDAPEVATRLAEAAQRLWEIEAYADALPLAERALAIRLVTEPASERLAGNLYQVGELHRALGDYAGALRRLQAAHDLWSRRLGSDSPEAATALHYLGVVRRATGDHEAARRLFETALAIRTRRLGPDDPLVATTLIALAGLRADAAKSEPGEASAAARAEAERLLQRAQGIGERRFGPDDPFVARCLAARARLFEPVDAAAARRLFEAALAIRVRALGPEHHLVAGTQADLAALLARTGETPAAEALYREALARSRRALDADHPQVTAILADLARLEWRRGERAAALEDALAAERLARNRFLRTGRGLTDGEALQYEAVRVSGLDVALSAAAEDAPGGGPALRRIADELIRSRALVLDRLTGRQGGTCIDARPGPGLDEVARALPTDSALLAYARYARIEPDGGGTAAYLAFVLRPGGETPGVIDLGDAGAIDTAIDDWSADLSVDPRLRPDPAGPGGEGGTIGRAAGERLRARIWDRLAPLVAGARLVLVVPDGAIARISLATLPVGGGGYLLETGPLLHLLGAERDVTRLLDRPPGGEGLLLFGAIDFDAEVGAPAPDPPAIAPGRFDPLAGTGAEIAAIAAGWRGGGETLARRGAAASVEAFRALAPGRRVLHLATHAWFLADEGAGAERPWSEEAGRSDRRLQRSGIALAGANRPDQAGILTAEEIAALDLSAADWVVLSACDTGRGLLVPGEGVIGLRRAFERAGARTVITSLWPADDGATRAWMQALYAERAAGRSTAEAVRDASLALVADARRQGRGAHPYFWGAFVAAGDWR